MIQIVHIQIGQKYNLGLTSGYIMNVTCIDKEKMNNGFHYLFDGGGETLYTLHSKQIKWAEIVIEDLDIYNEDFRKHFDIYSKEDLDTLWRILPSEVVHIVNCNSEFVGSSNYNKFKRSNGTDFTAGRLFAIDWHDEKEIFRPGYRQELPETSSSPSDEKYYCMSEDGKICSKPINNPRIIKSENVEIDLSSIKEIEIIMDKGLTYTFNPKQIENILNKLQIFAK